MSVDAHPSTQRIRLTCLGTADAFNADGRANSCYWIDDGLGAFTVDFGPTALNQIVRLGLDIDRLDAIFLTHLHGDHIGGLGVLVCGLQYRFGRTRPLTIVGPPGHEARVEQLIAGAYPSLPLGGLRFPLLYRRLAVPGRVDVGHRRVEAIRARHDHHAIATSFRVETRGRHLAFSGDTGWQPELADLVDGADVFLCECSDLEGSYWGHLSLDTIARHRDLLRPKRLWLTHLGTPSRAAATAQAEALDITVADDGMTLDLDVDPGG